MIQRNDEVFKNANPFAILAAVSLWIWLYSAVFEPVAFWLQEAVGGGWVGVGKGKGRWEVWEWGERDKEGEGEGGRGTGRGEVGRGKEGEGGARRRRGRWGGRVGI